jgi:5-methylcytosine-specific restriction enzyme A
MNQAKTERIPIPEYVRDYVLKRDNYKCKQCSKTSNLHIDHLKPLAKGGENDLSNLQILCSSCNLAKGSKFIS